MKGFRHSFVFLSCCLILASCESERHYYELNGQEVKKRKDGESMTLEDRFTGSFDVKKGVDGVGEASSNKVSSFQSKIDEARGGEKSFDGKSFKTGEVGDIRNKSFAGASMTFAAAKELDDRSKSAFTADNVPDFMKPGKGLSRQEYGGSSKDSGIAGKTYYEADGDFVTKMSPTTHQQESGYFESQRDKAPEPTIMSKDEYTKMTIEESRNFIGRNKDKAKRSDEQTTTVERNTPPPREE